jgi:hypothetical protein
MKSLSLILTGPQPHYDMAIYARDATKSDLRLTGPIGLDGPYRKGEQTELLSQCFGGSDLTLSLSGAGTLRRLLLRALPMKSTSAPLRS